jgi:Ca2+-binding EF-hand superfamily protein
MPRRTRRPAHAGPAPAATRFAAIPALLVACAGLAAAQSGGDYFSVVDTDHDARVSRAEYIERFSWAFVQMDANHDGVLEASEQLVPGSPRITLAEHRARLSAQFDKQDTDHDGSLGRREFLAPPAR